MRRLDKGQQKIVESLIKDNTDSLDCNEIMSSKSKEIMNGNVIGSVHVWDDEHSKPVTWNGHITDCHYSTTFHIGSLMVMSHVNIT